MRVDEKGNCQSSIANCQSGESVPPLVTLLRERIGEITRREAEGRPLIHLYGVGEYWVAFERSAYRLRRLFPRAMTTPMRFVGHPFPLVMVSVTDAELRAYTRLHLFQREGDDYGRLAAPDRPLSGYPAWHKRQTKGL